MLADEADNDGLSCGGALACGAGLVWEQPSRSDAIASDAGVVSFMRPPSAQYIGYRGRGTWRKRIRERAAMVAIAEARRLAFSQVDADFSA
jgi:hypothetical protein